VLLDCIAQEYAALLEAASLQLCTAGTGTYVQADSSREKQVQTTEMSTAEEQA
jgi:hypothetical protein